MSYYYFLTLTVYILLLCVYRFEIFFFFKILMFLLRTKSSIEYVLQPLIFIFLLLFDLRNLDATNIIFHVKFSFIYIFFKGKHYDLSSYHT